MARSSLLKPAARISFSPMRQCSIVSGFVNKKTNKQKQRIARDKHSKQMLKGLMTTQRFRNSFPVFQRENSPWKQNEEGKRILAVINFLYASPLSCLE